MVAGQPSLVIPLGGSATANIIIVDTGGSPIPFKVIPPVLNTIPHNTTPTVTITPMNGTLAPNSQQVIHVTVYMPSNNRQNLVWQGIIQIVEIPPNTTTSGNVAVVVAGLAKILTITSAKPIGLPIIYYVIGIVIVAAIIVGIVYYWISRKKAAKAREARLAAARKIAKRVAPKRAARKKAAKKAARARKAPAKMARTGRARKTRAARRARR